MLKPKGQPRGREWGPASIGAWLLRSWVVRGLAIAFAVVILAAALYANALVRASNEAQCDVFPPVELTMEELIALRRRVSAYQVDPAPSATLALSGAEVGALFGEGDAFSARVDVRGDRARIDLAIPGERGCWNVGFVGRLRVDDGVAIVSPEELRIGDADLTWVARLRTWSFRSDRMPDERVASTLDNTRSLEVIDGQVFVRLSNRWDVW